MRRLVGGGYPQAALELRGQGYKDGGEDVRSFRRAVAEGRVTPAPAASTHGGDGRGARSHGRSRQCQAGQGHRSGPENASEGRRSGVFNLGGCTRCAPRHGQVKRRLLPRRRMRWRADRIRRLRTRAAGERCVKSSYGEIIIAVGPATGPGVLKFTISYPSSKAALGGTLTAFWPYVGNVTSITTAASARSETLSATHGRSVFGKSVCASMLQHTLEMI